MLTFFAFIFVFGILVFVHEFGHFAIAKLTGIKVEEFALGYGPVLFGKHLGETRYALRMVPLGGFCKLAGEFEESSDFQVRDESVKDRFFDSKPVLTRMGVIAAGPAMNFVLAIVLFLVIFTVAGVLVLTVLEVQPNSPAERAGLLKGDVILSVNGYGPSPDEILMLISQSPNTTLRMEVLREGKRLTLVGVPQFDIQEGRALLKFSPGLDLVRLGVLETAGFSIKYCISLGRTLLMGIWRMLTGAMKPAVAGPIGIVEMVGQAARYGILDLLNFTAILSINLGVLNLLPIPVLDGGWLLFLAIEGIFRKPVNAEIRGVAQIVGMVLLLLLLVFATYNDVSRLISM
jgi:regulator of sigma E protease